MASTPVHPHACGEYITGDCWKLALRGSSPRVWGIPVQIGNLPHNKRFIPTRVGNTASTAAGRPHNEVHPHACGEYAILWQTERMARGSSPRVWGIHSPPETWRTFTRFIPTRVGNTYTFHLIMSNAAVHPHACGEYSHYSSPGFESFGSSPRVWGIPARITHA